MPRRGAGADRAASLREDRQREGRRLAGARLRDADQVVPREDLRNGRSLDGRRLGVTGFLDGFENVGIETEGAKWHRPRTMEPERALALRNGGRGEGPAGGKLTQRLVCQSGQLILRGRE